VATVREVVARVEKKLLLKAARKIIQD